MSDFDSADLLSKLVQTLGLPTTRSAPTDVQLYVLLSNAQRRIADLLAAHVPWTQYAAPELLTSADSGATYTFAYEPRGYAEIRESRSGATLVPVPEWSGSTSGFVMEGKTIRWPGGATRTFSDGPYARYVRVPDVIDASTQPILKPPHARLAVVYDAAVEYALQGGNADPSPYQLLLQRFLWGDANTLGSTGFIHAEKTLYAAMGGRGGDGRWWVGQNWA